MRKPSNARSTKLVKIQISARATLGTNPASSASRHPIHRPFSPAREPKALTGSLWSRTNPSGASTVPRCGMSIHDGYSWYAALIWPDTDGVPTAVIRDWDPNTQNLGSTVATVHFSDDKPFRQVMEDLYYEIAPRTPAVTAKGVYVILRRETVPVTVRANRAATVGA
jgi:hypothetical protein